MIGLASLVSVLKWLVISVVSAALAWFALSFALYRIPSSALARVVEGEVHFKHLELRLSNRSIFEDKLGNRRIRLDRSEDEEDDDAFYIPEAQKKRLWEMEPVDVRERKQTLRIKLKSRQLLFGGNAPAEIVSIERINKEPRISK